MDQVSSSQMIVCIMKFGFLYVRDINDAGLEQSLMVGWQNEAGGRRSSVKKKGPRGFLCPRRTSFSSLHLQT